MMGSIQHDEARLHEFRDGGGTGLALWQRTLILAYGVVCYAAFFATFLYAFGFVAGLVTPTSLDRLPGEGSMSWCLAVLVNLGLLGLFSVQHSVMARPGFKRWWTRFVPEPAERSTYVLLSSLALIAMFVFWQPIGGVVWHAEQPAVRGVLYGLMASGWLLVLVSTFMINHFDLFGLRQVWLCFRNRAYTHLPFGTPWLYARVRHPLYLGWLIGFWATPTMTAAHLLFALATTAYILMAIRWEERDLQTFHGARYTEYRNRVPMLVPRVRAVRGLASGTMASHHPTA